MRMLKVAVLVAVSAAAAAAQGMAPIEASLRRGAGEALFYVDQPAYVAVFEVIPGSGVQQLYPRSSFQASEQVQRGEYLLSRPFRSQYGYYGWNNSMPYARPVYMIDGSGQIRSYYYTTGWTGNRAMSPRRTLLLVASRKPLRQVGSPDAARHWLQQAVGFRAISNTVYAPESMLNDIVAAVLPMGATVDDVVVDVLEIEDESYSDRMWMGRSLVFQCPGGTQAVAADFFFATGVFYCPPVPRRSDVTPTPGTPAPGDTLIMETFNPKARRVPPKTEVEGEGVRPYRPGATPNQPNPMGEEGFRVMRRGVTSTPATVAPTAGVPSDAAPATEGFRAFRGTRQAPAGADERATVTVATPVDLDWRARTISPTTSAWVPPTAGVPSSNAGYGSARYSPASTPEGYTRRSISNGYMPTNTNHSTGTSSSTAVGTTSAAPSAPAPSVESARPAAQAGVGGVRSVPVPPL